MNPATITTVRSRGPWALAFERLRHDRAAIAAGATLVGVLLLAVLAPVIARLVGHGPGDQFLDVGLSPSGIPIGPNRTFLLGTDSLGRDVLVRIAYGTRVSLLVGVLASALAVLVGTVVGIAAGWYGGMVDRALSRLMDVVLSLPFLVFALALVAVVGPSLTISVTVIAFFTWASVGGSSGRRRCRSASSSTCRRRARWVRVTRASCSSRSCRTSPPRSLSTRRC